MNEQQKMVLEFHKKFGCGIQTTPAFPSSNNEVRLILALITEETEELREAIGYGTLEEAADAIGDLLYVTYGAAIRMGIDIEPIFAEIHRANMLKENGTTRKDGKIMKPEGWQPPKIDALLKEQQNA